MNINNERFDIFNLFSNIALITYPNTALFKVKVKHFKQTNRSSEVGVFKQMFICKIHDIAKGAAGRIHAEHAK